MSKEAMRAAHEALTYMVCEQIDYTTRNRLGDPLQQHGVKLANAALSLLRAELEAGGEATFKPAGEPSEIWNSPMHDLQERLEICAGAVAFERKVATNMRRQRDELAASPVAADTQGDAKTQQRLMALADRMPVQPWGIGSRREDAIAFARAALEELK